MSIAEAALYGDLVRRLRDVCAQQLAQLKGISIESERAALDDVIRAWFFTPQDDLYGLTPQRMIRNEELGIANTIPGDRLGDMFEDDCPVCAAMRAEAEAGITAGPSAWRQTPACWTSTILKALTSAGASKTSA